MIYLTSAELNTALTTATANKELYFQDIALFPAFLLLSSEELARLPQSMGLTQVFEITKKIIKTTLPGATWNNLGEVCPIGMQLSPFEMSSYLLLFNDSSVRSISNQSYTLYDDISSDKFVIMPSSTSLASLNELFTGSHRISPPNVIKTLQRVGVLLKNISASNTTAIPDPMPAPTPDPDPTPTGPVTTMNVLSRLWRFGRGMQSNGPILSLVTDVPGGAVASSYTSQNEINAIEAEMERVAPNDYGFIQNGRIISFMGGSTMNWDVVR